MRRPMLVAALVLACAAVVLPAQAAGPGQFDTTFSGDGFTTVDFTGVNETLYGVAIDGNEPAACGADGSVAAVAVAKFKAGGALDDSFSGDGKFRQNTLGNNYSYLEACRFLPDGRLVGAGAAKADDGNDRMIVMVLRPNGRLDTRFSGDGIAVIRFPGMPNVYAYDLAIQPDGKILAVGETYDNSTTPIAGSFAIARLKPNGALDTSFSGDGRAKVDFHAGDEGVWKVLVQPDGKILLAGWVKSADDSQWNTGVARLKPNGALDGTFSGDGKAEYNFLKGSDDYALGLATRPDGRAVLGVYGYNAPDYKPRIAQVLPSGKLDTSFGGDGVVPITTPFSMQELLLQGKKIVVAGGSATSTPVLIRCTANGAPDASFGTNGVADLGAGTWWLYDAALDAKGRIVVAGRSSGDGLVLRVLS